MCGWVKWHKTDAFLLGKNSCRCTWISWLFTTLTGFTDKIQILCEVLVVIYEHTGQCISRSWNTCQDNDMRFIPRRDQNFTVRRFGGGVQKNVVSRWMVRYSTLRCKILVELDHCRHSCARLTVPKRVESATDYGRTVKYDHYISATRRRCQLTPTLEDKLRKASTLANWSGHWRTNSGRQAYNKADEIWVTILRILKVCYFCKFAPECKFIFRQTVYLNIVTVHVPYFNFFAQLSAVWNNWPHSQESSTVPKLAKDILYREIYI